MMMNIKYVYFLFFMLTINWNNVKCVDFYTHNFYLFILFCLSNHDFFMNIVVGLYISNNTHHNDETLIALFSEYIHEFVCLSDQPTNINYCFIVCRDCSIHIVACINAITK